MGIIQCPFKLGGHSFEFNFIVCRNLTRPIILGLDFKQKHQIWLGWSDTRKGLLTLEDKMLVETINVCEIGPQLTKYSHHTLPPRTLAIVNVYVDLKGNSTKHTYEVKPNSLLMDQHPNMVIIPVIHITPEQTDTIVPFHRINLSTKSVFLPKHGNLGFLDQTDTEICEITTSSAVEPLALEVTSQQLENPSPYRESKFICSPADISVHRKVGLQDAEESEDI